MLIPEDVKRKELVEEEPFTDKVRIARVVKVYDAENYDTNYGKVELLWLDTGTPVNGLVDFIEPSSSILHGCGIFSMPSVNDLAVCLPQQNGSPIILGFINTNKYKSSTMSPTNNGSVGFIPKLHAGEYFIKSRAQSSIYLKRDGSLDINIQSNTESLAVPLNKQDNNTVPIIPKANGSAENTAFEIHVGNSNRASGSANTVYSAGTYAYANLIYTLNAVSGQTRYQLTIPAQATMVSINSISLLGGNNTRIKTFNNSDIVFSTSYSYASQDVLSDATTAIPCTLDKEVQSVWVDLPYEIISAMGNSNSDESRILQIEYTIKTLKGGIRINREGDVFIDGRNVVIRSLDSKASLGLLDSGTSILNCKSAQIGDVLGGSLLLDRGGVILSSGTSANGDIIQCGAHGPNGLATIFGRFIYFYVTTDLPLVKYDTETDTFSLVSSNEYKALPVLDKYRICARPYDPDDTEVKGAFTQKKFSALLAATPTLESYDTLRAT